MTISFQPPNPVQRALKRLASTAPSAWLLSKTLRHLDRSVLMLTRGRHTATSLFAGLPVILLTTTGAKSGQLRTTPLICGVDGERLVLFATNFGGAKNPAWYYNLRANPQVTVTYRGHLALYYAREATTGERNRYWPMADAIYAGYAAYRARASHRDIPVVVLERGHERGMAASAREG